MSYFTELDRQYIDGSWRPGHGAWDIIDFNPYNGDKLASITVASVEEIDEAYRAADSLGDGGESTGAAATGEPRTANESSRASVRRQMRSRRWLSRPRNRPSSSRCEGRWSMHRSPVSASV